MDFLSGVIDVPQIELHFTPDFTAEELQQRRQRIAMQIGDGAHLLVASAPPNPYRSNLQDAKFYYFTGMETCHTYLLIEGGSGISSVFLQSRETMPGEPETKLGYEDAELIKKKTGIENVFSSAELTAKLTGIKTLFVPHAETEGGGASFWDGKGCAKRREEEEWDKAEPDSKRLIRLLGERFPSMGIEDAVPFISAMRSIKSAAEIEVLRKSASMTAHAAIEAMKATRPGISENDLQAIAENVFRKQGRAGTAYPCIIAGGKRTWDGHYHLNSITLNKDDIVLFDCAPDFRHYASDIGRIWPVGGTYSPWHRQIYGFITEYHKTLISLVRPGVLLKDLYAEADGRMSKLCDGPDTPYAEIRPLFEQMVEKGIGYFNHAVGMSAHDCCGSWSADTLKEGQVFVCDPMVWCGDRHEYIRVEDTLLVTADGCERLTGAAPIELDEIESLVGTGVR